MGCSYCNEMKEDFFENSITKSVRIEGNNLKIKVVEGNLSNIHKIEVDIPINYCPKCRKKIKKLS